MNKKKLIHQLIEITKANLLAAIEAAQNTYDIATHEENKAENKYDTRGLEASYLAGAQAGRVADIKATLASYENIEVRTFTLDSKIALSALIEICTQEKNSFVLLMPKGGGQIVHFEKKQIQVITPESPLGRQLIGKNIGDVIEIPLGSSKKEYEIINLI